MYIAFSDQRSCLMQNVFDSFQYLSWANILDHAFSSSIHPYRSILLGRFGKISFGLMTCGLDRQDSLQQVLQVNDLGLSFRSRASPIVLIVANQIENVKRMLYDHTYHTTPHHTDLSDIIESIWKSTTIFFCLDVGPMRYCFLGGMQESLHNGSFGSFPL